MTDLELDSVGLMAENIVMSRVEKGEEVPEDEIGRIFQTCETFYRIAEKRGHAKQIDEGLDEET